MGRKKVIQHSVQNTDQKPSIGSNLQAWSKLPKICLNMIVKNEAHIIKETLESVLKYIDYWVISDTGSTDGTQEIIQEFFKSNNTPGELYQDKWKNFGHNRTLSFKHAEGKSQYIWVMDADDVVRGDLVFPDPLIADSYNFTYGTGMTHLRQQLFKNDPILSWRYVCVLHEYAECKKKDPIKLNITGDYYIDSRRLGDRSKDPDKYKKDALLLEKSILEEPQFKDRYTFYIAQSWFDYGDYEKGIEWYQKRAALGGWFEEVYYSLYRVAEGMVLLKRPWDQTEQAYLAAWEYDKNHAEPLFKIATYYRLQNDFKNAYEWAKKASKIPLPTHLVLFVFRDVYEYRIFDELAIAAFYTGHYEESYNLCQKLLDDNIVPADSRTRIIQNLEFSKQALEDKKKPVALIYLGNMKLDNDNDTSINNLFENLRENFQIVIVSDHIIRNQSDIFYLTILQWDKYRTHDKIIPQIIFLFDSVNYLYKYSEDVPSIPIVLVQLDTNFKLTYSTGLKISITNKSILEKLLTKITSIITYDTVTYDKLRLDLGLGNQVLYLDNMGTNDFTMFSETKPTQVTIKIMNEDVEHNGFKYIYPESYILFNEKKIIYDWSSNLLIDFHFDLVKNHPEQPEFLVELADTYCDQDNHVMGKLYYDKALKLIQDNLSYDSYCQIINIKLASCLTKAGEYLESHRIASDAINSDKLPDIMRNKGTVIRDKNIDNFKDIYLAYPKDKIEFMRSRVNQTNNNQVLLTMTTCKRLDLFTKTVNSFLNCCQDLDLIDRWVVIDDNSSIEDRKKMQDLYPFITFVFKKEAQKGHSKSINMVYDMAQNYKYLLHMEDDFHFVVKQSYLAKAIKILEHDKDIGQVLFNRNYAEIDYSKTFLSGGIAKMTTDNIRYIIHEYVQSGTIEHKKYNETYKNSQNCGYWPHFSFRPSVMRVSMLQRLWTILPYISFRNEIRRRICCQRMAIVFL